MTLYAVFQAFKFMTTDPALAELIRTQPSARSARREAGYHRDHQRSDWFDVNVEVMDVILHAKFTQHKDLREKLLETGNRELIEDSPVRFSVPSLPHFYGLNQEQDDVFWGIGRDGQGRNELGKALVRLRGRLRECAHCSPSPSVPIEHPDPASVCVQPYVEMGY